MKKPRVNEMVNETNLSPEIGFQHVRELLRSFGPIRPSRQIQSHLVLNKVPEIYKLSAERQFGENQQNKRRLICPRKL